MRRRKQHIRWIWIWPLIVLAVLGFYFRGEIAQGISSLRTKPVLVDTERLPWYLTLVNREYPMPQDWEIELTQLRDDQRVDTRMYPALQEMFDACRADGLYPLVWSSYRSEEEQQQILDNKIESFRDQGYEETSAKEEALRWAQAPGYSEHQLGLAVDINSEDEALCSSQAIYDWLKTHCQEYGFILRYPQDKENITGISYEAWHFRYVGKDAAKEIMEKGLCLEEYLMEHYSANQDS